MRDYEIGFRKIELVGILLIESRQIGILASIDGQYKNTLNVTVNGIE